MGYQLVKYYAVNGRKLKLNRQMRGSIGAIGRLTVKRMLRAKDWGACAALLSVRSRQRGSALVLKSPVTRLIRTFLGYTRFRQEQRWRIDQGASSTVYRCF